MLDKETRPNKPAVTFATRMAPKRSRRSRPEAVWKLHIRWQDIEEHWSTDEGVCLRLKTDRQISRILDKTTKEITQC